MNSQLPLTALTEDEREKIMSSIYGVSEYDKDNVLATIESYGQRVADQVRREEAEWWVERTIHVHDGPVPCYGCARLHELRSLANTSNTPDAAKEGAAVLTERKMGREVAERNERLEDQLRVAQGENEHLRGVLRFYAYAPSASEGRRLFYMDQGKKARDILGE